MEITAGRAPLRTSNNGAGAYRAANSAQDHRVFYASIRPGMMHEILASNNLGAPHAKYANPSFSAVRHYALSWMSLVYCSSSGMVALGSRLDTSGFCGSWRQCGPRCAERITTYYHRHVPSPSVRSLLDQCWNTLEKRFLLLTIYGLLIPIALPSPRSFQKAVCPHSVGCRGAIFDLLSRIIVSISPLAG